MSDFAHIVYQGGDWGNTVSSTVFFRDGSAALTSLMQLGKHTVYHYGHKHVKGWLTNMPELVLIQLTRTFSYSLPAFRTLPPTFQSFPLLYTKSLLTLPFDKTALARLAATAKWSIGGRGYSTQQCTRPQTLGYGLSDSPVGLLAWIYEKLVGWTDKYPWTDDEGVFSPYRRPPRVPVLLTTLYHPWMNSPRVDLHILVFARRTRSDDEDLLRDDGRRCAVHPPAPRLDVRPARCGVLPC